MPDAMSRDPSADLIPFEVMEKTTVGGVLKFAVVAHRPTYWQEGFFRTRWRLDPEVVNPLYGRIDDNGFAATGMSDWFEDRATAEAVAAALPPTNPLIYGRYYD